MNCTTCCFSLRKVRDDLYHCGSCGTLIDMAPGTAGHWTVPELVTQCREFQAGNLYTGGERRRVEQWLAAVGPHIRQGKELADELSKL